MKLERFGFIFVGLCILGLGVFGIVQSNRAFAHPIPAEPGESPVELELLDPAGQVTKSEAHAALLRLETAIKRVALGSPGKTPSGAVGAGPMSRREIASEMHRLFEACKPEFKVTPRMVAVDRSAITMAEGKERKMLETLIEYGCVAKVGPLATSKNTGLSIEEFGDALAYLLLRLAELTHTPSSRWSPFMNEHEGALDPSAEDQRTRDEFTFGPNASG